jgi:N-acetylneuraminic acid mutarotase
MQRAARARHGLAVVATVATTLALCGLQQSAFASSSISANGATNSPAAAAKSAAAPRTLPANVREVCPAATRPDQMQCLSLQLTSVRSFKGVSRNQAPSGYGPADLHSAYNLPNTGGAGETVGIVDAYDDPNAEADLAVYRAQYGLPPCTTANGCFKKVDENGGTNYPAPPPSTDDWTGEESLDIDMVSAICPACHIILAEASQPTTQDLGTAVNTTVRLGAKFESNSYGGSEDPSDTTADRQYFDHPGVAVTASSGDGGYGVEYPAASPYVTSVGGTALTRDASVPRGWSETVWNNQYGAPGSGCSAYEPKPSWQKDTGCAKRTVADVSAVADPATGVAVYDSWGSNTGWGQYGGTSVASPIIASTYALAGAPGTGDTPASYAYSNAQHLNDVTQGSDGSCSPAYLCTAGPGYDGPTGLGTPNGLLAFTKPGPHGTVTGTVTNAKTRKPVAGATVTVGQGVTTTDSKGHYQLIVPVGSYTVSVSAFGYHGASKAGVKVSGGGTDTENFALTAEPSVTVTGALTDGSGRGWPMYAQLSVLGTPLAPTYSSPYSGYYSLTLPANASYQVQITPRLNGYAPVTQTLTLGGSNTTQNIALPVDNSVCDAAGYAFDYTGMPVQGFDTTSTPTNWTVSNAPNTVGGWEFDDPGNRGNRTGGSGGFAIVDSDHDGVGHSQDSTLTTPVTDLSGVSDPVIGFNTYYFAYSGQTANVDVSTDGGTTWTNVWAATTTSVAGYQSVDISKLAANQAKVQVRFHFTGTWAEYWELDNVWLGARNCQPTSVVGGLVAGRVVDANTGQGVNGAQVTDSDLPTDTTSTAATPGDNALRGGFYLMFSNTYNSHPFTATMGAYVTATESVNVAPNWVTEADFTLDAGRLVTSTPTITKSVVMGNRTTATFRISNTGTAPAHYKIDQVPGNFTILGVRADVTANAAGAPRHLVPGTYSDHMVKDATIGKQALRPATTPFAAPWASLPNYPIKIMDNSVAAAPNGVVYSVGGTVDGTGPNASSYAYDPTSQQWTTIPDPPTKVQQAAAAVLNGKLVLAGGWTAAGALNTVQIYDTSSHSWSSGPALPAAIAAAGHAVLNDKLYVVGGCTTGNCAPGSTATYVYDPAKNSWSTAANYPSSVAFESCGAVNGQLVCAGGQDPDTSTASKATYAYNPATNSWSQGPDMPVDAWASSYVGANNKLVVTGGVINASSAITNQSEAFTMSGTDPASGHWTALPNANNAQYRGGGSCGFDQVGGDNAPWATTNLVQQLPGYNACGNPSVKWLGDSPAQLTLAPGQSATVTVTLDARNMTVIPQPGSYTAQLVFETNTPYSLGAVGVVMKATPPANWAKIQGTVKGLDCKGKASALAGATVQIDSRYGTYTLRTDASGGYALWLNARDNPLTVIAAWTATHRR